MITGNVSKSSWLDHYVFLAYIHRRFLCVLSLELFGSILGANYRVTYQDWTCINIEIFCVLSDRCISEFTMLSSLLNLARNNYFWMSNPALSPCSHTPQPAVAGWLSLFLVMWFLLNIVVLSWSLSLSTPAQCPYERTYSLHSAHTKAFLSAFLRSHINTSRLTALIFVIFAFGLSILPLNDT